MQTKQPELSLIVPCYNSGVFLEKELPVIIDYLKQYLPDYELILVDDGSQDRDNAAVLARTYDCIYQKLPVNMGKGAALRQGFSIATGKVQVFTDSDFPFEPDAILSIQRIIGQGKAELAIGDRTNPHSEYYIQVSWIRKIGSYIIAGIGKKLLKNHIVDTQCGIKGFSAEAAKILFPATITNRFGIDFELLLLASRLELSIEKIPVRLRTNYPSSVNVVSDGLRIIKEIYLAIKHHGRNKKKRGQGKNSRVVSV